MDDVDRPPLTFSPSLAFPLAARTPRPILRTMTVNEMASSESRLRALLADAGSSLSLDDADALLRGVLAAPPAHDPDAWLALTGAEPGSELAAALTARKAVLAQAPSPADPAGRLAALRAALAERGLDGFVIPHADEFQNEYLPVCAERLAWLTGFTGSAGQAVATRDKAAIFVDGRYTLQVRAQVPEGLYDYRHLTEDPLDRWVTEAMAAGSTLGFDPRLHTPAWSERLEAALGKAGITLVACTENPVDALWTGRPAAPLSPLVVHPLRFAGRSVTEKLAEVTAVLRRKGIDAVVLTAPESVAWLFNLRGGDVACTPLPLGRAIVGADGTVSVFVDPRAVLADTRAALEPTVRFAAPEAFADALDALGRAKATVQVDPVTVSVWIADRLGAAGATVERESDPCALPRARKNPVELEGSRNAHRRDGAAMVRFLRWFEAEAPKGTLTERSAADRLLAYRAEVEHFRGLSFETIPGFASNGAIVHYHVSDESDRRIAPDGLFLLDSGGQYLDGTTDVTRTLAVGEPSAQMRLHYTTVLKGMIALATARFPAGTTGSQLDPLARAPLWALGLDYDHGTGHGVGSYLSVHEGPARISKVHNTVALEPGMILSDEPGYYATGAYGIRIENLIAVRAADHKERPFLEFETLTLVPFDRRLIDAGHLSPAERAWVDAYHQRVARELCPLLDAPTAAWLAGATAPLSL